MECYLSDSFLIYCYRGSHLSIKDIINVWVVKTGYAGIQARDCLKKNVISFDLELHILDEFEEDLSSSSNSTILQDRYKLLDQKYDDFTNNLIIELESSLDDFNYFSGSPLRAEKISRLKTMLEGMNRELTGFHKVMDKFDEFEIIEQLKTAIRDKLCSIAESKLETWSSDMARFSISILTGDIVIMPLPEKSLFAIGRVMGGYEYDNTETYTRHYHRVEWLNMQVPFPELKEELNRSSAVFLLTGESKEKILGMLVSTRKRPSELIWGDS